MPLERDEVNPDKSDIDGRTPLSCAASTGHEELVQMLLEQGEVSPDKPGNDSRTRLSHAASKGYAGVAQILLGRDNAGPSKLDQYGQIPLRMATQRGHTAVMVLQPAPPNVTQNLYHIRFLFLFSARKYSPFSLSFDFFSPIPHVESRPHLIAIP